MGVKNLPEGSLTWKVDKGPHTALLPLCSKMANITLPQLVRGDPCRAHTLCQGLKSRSPLSISVQVCTVGIYSGAVSIHYHFTLLCETLYGENFLGRLIIAKRAWSRWLFLVN